MSYDEIRVQKALALLEFRKAEERIALLEKEKADLTAEAAGDVLHRLHEARKQQIAALEKGYVLHRLHEARKQLADATAKKLQFGA